MIEYIINNKSNVLHKRVHGRTLEQCNIDQLDDKDVFIESDWFYVESLLNSNQIRWCKRCQPNKQ